MRMIKYKPIKELLYHEDIGIYISYGVAVYENKQFANKVSDVTTSRRKIFKLCRFCKKHKIKPECLIEILSNIIGR